ncbi:hypothetical protein K9N08_01570 [Candidatus Gracilibacteria bacterium]|nr:hypothetical protein [Candidatus Gracilibacteria bacterium]MCF7856229.1 hypothetical protein [Candidatus Gracilibacteria bacterium]MCF7896706.1 hypothetical protein [Candidatus Gracilibacteria bacterium]
MLKKLLAGLIGIVSCMLTLNSVMASQIPAGYVLVPAEAFFGQNIVSPATTAEISTIKSSLRVNDEIGYVGENYSTVTATLRDEAGKPLADSLVNLISSRTTDLVENLQNTTNANGEIVFRVRANEEGVSSFTAVAQNQTIVERPRIVFLKKSGGIGGELLAADVLADGTESAATATNQVEVDFPEKVGVDSPTDITIEIKNAGGEVAENFVGTVVFQSSDTLAILPQDYEFTPLDRGRHVFANAITFTSEGSQTINVSGDSAVAPKEITVQVGNGTEDAEAPIVTSPADGELLNETVTLLGTAAANSNLAVFADGQFLVKGESDVVGNFLLEADLFDGEHEITVAILDMDNSVRATSEAIRVVIDKTLPEIEDLILSPGSKVVAGSVVKINLKSEPDLEKVRLSVGEVSVELEDIAGSGNYLGEFTAPQSGDYLLEIDLTDAAGNVGEYPAAASLIIGTRITIDEVEATPRDGRVDLRWNPPTNSLDIQNYEIFYGTDSENLDSKFATLDNRTSWFIDRLQNKTNYFFQIISLDAAGNQNGGSEVLEATPAATFVVEGCDSKAALRWETSTDSRVTSYRIDYGIASKNYSESRILPGGTSRDGWEVRDLINGAEYFFVLRGINDFGEVVADLGSEESTTPNFGETCEQMEDVQLSQRQDENGDIFLIWNEVAGATSYRIYAGNQPNIFNLPTVEIEETSFQPKGLKKNSDYFFAVSAVYAGGHESAAFSNLLKVEVGPAEVLLISALFGVIAAFLLRRKKLLKS